MKIIRFAFLLLSAGLLRAQPADFIPLPVSKGERSVSLIPAGVNQGMGAGVLWETVNPQGEIRHRVLSEGGSILELPLSWRVLPGENSSSILMQKEDKLACYYWNYPDYVKHGISFTLNPTEQLAWKRLGSEPLARKGSAQLTGCGFGFDDDAGMHHKWLIAPEGAREVGHHPVGSGVSRGNISIGGATCLEGCLIIGGVNITNSGYGPLDQNGSASEDHSSTVDEAQFVCDTKKGLQVHYSKTKSNPVNPAMTCDSAKLYQAECVLDVLVTWQGTSRTVSVADIEKAKIFRSLLIDEGEHAFISVTWCVPQFYFISKGIAFRVGNATLNREMSITTLQPESLKPISWQETELK